MNRPEINYLTRSNSRYSRFRSRRNIIKNRLVSPLGLSQKKATFPSTKKHRKEQTDTSDDTDQVKSSEFVQALKRVCQSTSIIVAINLLIWMSVASWKSNPIITTNPWLIFSFLLITIILFIGSYLLTTSLKHSSFMIFVSILLAVAVIKIILISIYTLHPTSDFFNYHYFAFIKAAGLPWTKKLIGMNLYSPHVLNIAMFYSIPYSIIGTNFFTSQLLNIILTFFDGLLIYRLGDKTFNKQAGMFAALIFSMIPAYFLYSTLNGAEPMFLTAVLGLMNSFHTFMTLDSKTSPSQWVGSFRNLTVLSIITYMIRPTIGIWLIVGIIYLMLMRYPYKQNTKLKLTRLSVFVAFAAVFMIFSTFSTPLFSKVYNLPFLNNSVNNRYSLATGTSLSTNGSFNQKYFQKLNRDLKDSTSTSELNKKADSDMSKQVNENINQINRKKAWTTFIAAKYSNFTNENYGYNWILYNTGNKNHLEKNYLALKNPLIAFSTVFFEVMIILATFIMALVLFFRTKIKDHRQISNQIFYQSLILNGFILGSMLFEVQGRYHVILYIPMVLVLGSGAMLLGRRHHKLAVFF